MSESQPVPSRRAVFLSYAREDVDAARRIADALRSHDVEMWLDQRELVGGDAWDGKIKGQIGSCALFIPVISANTQARKEGYFRLEWKLAEDRSHLMAKGVAFIVPVSTDATSERGALVPDAFLAVQWTRLPGGEMSSAFVGRVQTLLGLEVAPVSDRRTEALKTTDAGQPPSPEAMARQGRPALPRPAIPLWAWGGLAVFACALGIWMFRSQPTSVASKPVAPAPAAKPPLDLPSVGSAKEGKSIAVLPFTNMSDDKDASAFFADGIHEDILTNLAHISELRVVSRTSVMEYRGTKENVRTIA